jgi:hypothetical protein
MAEESKALGAHLWYVLPVGNFTSGHAHASANDTARVSPAGTAVDAATAAPTDDPGLDAASPAPLKEPFCFCTQLPFAERFGGHVSEDVISSPS